MKKAMTCLGLVVLLALGLLALSSKAQAQTRTVVSANVPFEFNIGEKHFSSGKLFITKAGITEILSGTNGTEAAFFQAMRMVKPDKAPYRFVLRFNSYGGHYFLSEVWEGDVGYQLYRSGTEVRLAKAMEAQGTDVTAVGK